MTSKDGLMQRCHGWQRAATSKDGLMQRCLDGKELRNIIEEEINNGENVL